MSSAIVNGKHYTIRKLRPAQLAFAEQNQRDAGLWAAEPVYSRYFKPAVLEAGLVGGTIVDVPRTSGPHRGHRSVALDSADGTALFEKIIDLALA